MNFISKKELFLLLFYSFFQFAIFACDPAKTVSVPVEITEAIANCALSAPSAVVPEVIVPAKIYVTLDPDITSKAPLAGGQLKINEYIGDFTKTLRQTTQAATSQYIWNEDNLIVRTIGLLWKASKLVYRHPYITTGIALAAADGVLYLQVQSEIKRVIESREWIIGEESIKLITQINKLKKGSIINYFALKSDFENVGIVVVLTPPCNRDKAFDYLKKEIIKIDKRLLSLKKWTPFEKYSNGKLISEQLLTDFKKEFSFEFPVSISTCKWPINFPCPSLSLDMIKNNLSKLKTLGWNLGYDSSIISIDVKLPWIYGVFGLMNIASDLAFELLYLKECYNKFIDKINL